QEFTNLALSLHKDPARFVKEFAPVVEYCQNLGFTPEEEEIILAFAKTSLNKGVRDTSKIRFGDLSQALKRSWREIRDRLDVAATCKGIRRKYSMDQLLEMRAKLCEEEDSNMRTLVGEWKLEDGTPDYGFVDMPPAEGWRRSELRNAPLRAPAQPELGTRSRSLGVDFDDDDELGVLFPHLTCSEIGGLIASDGLFSVKSPSDDPVLEDSAISRLISSLSEVKG
ncbi:hypothetical protein HDU76_010109, partial [Blyttiomyces sp. JEL0837]